MKPDAASLRALATDANQKASPPSPPNPPRPRPVPVPSASGSDPASDILLFQLFASFVLSFVGELAAAAAAATCSAVTSVVFTLTPDQLRERER